MPKQRVTMADVAHEAGVSLMTVSRVVNGKDGISESTRQRIQKIIDRLGYRPSDIARSLVTDRTRTIGLVVVDNTNPFFSEIARGVEHEAYAQGYNVFLCNTDEDIERECAVLRSLQEKRVDGVLLCSPRLDESPLRAALEQHPAVVLVNRRLEKALSGGIMINDERGGRLAAEHLLSRGHRSIGFLAGPDRSYSGQQRARGFRAALDRAGVDLPPGCQRVCLPVVDSGRKEAHQLLTDHPQVTALFCYNDLSAVGALRACALLGRRVPDDIAVVGFDDIPLAALVTPPLTTFRIPLYDLGNQAMRRLLEYIDRGSGSCEDFVFEPELIIRESAP